MQHFGFDKKRILGDLNKNNFFKSKGGILWFRKNGFCCAGGNFAKKNILRFWESLKYV